MNLFNRTQTLIPYGIAFLAGCALVYAFAPYHLTSLAFVAPALLYLLLPSPLPTKEGFKRGLFFGLGLCGLGISWVHVSIHTFGNTSLAFSIAFTSLFVFVIALFYAFTAAAYLHLAKHTSTLLNMLLFSTLWVLFEWIRGWLLTGFPWLYIGNTQVNSPLAAFAPILGVYGCSLIVVMIATALASLVTKGPSIKQKSLSLAGVTIIGLATWLLASVEWTETSSERHKISLIQGNVAQELKWEPSHRSQMLSLYQELTEQHWDSEIVIWPENAIPMFFHQARGYLGPLAQKAESTQTTIITGLPYMETSSGNYYNSMIAIGNGFGLYHKIHLVPFGEYLPLKSLLGRLVDLFGLPLSNFSSGPYQQPRLSAGGMSIAPYVCYEIAYPDYVAKTSANSHVIVTVSNDTWFGQSIGPHQHFQLAQMRALETGRYVLRTTNNGITAIINPQGRVTDQLPQFEQGVLVGHYRSAFGITPFARFGSTPTILFCLLVLIGCFMSKRLKKHQTVIASDLSSS